MRVVLMNEWDGELPQEDELEVRNVDGRALQRLVTGCRPRSLRIYHFTAPSLEGIDSLATLTDLTVDWAPKVTSLAPLFRMTGLRRLALNDLARVNELEGIQQLRRLTELNLQGGMWKPLRLRSLRPVADLPFLERLTAINTRLIDDDISCLTSLSTLRELRLSNQFERSQVAHVARHLNSQLEPPLAAYLETQMACKRCGEKTLMFTGRRMPFLCPSCDSARVTKLTGEFQALIVTDCERSCR